MSFKEFLKRWDKPPVRITLNCFCVFFLINLIILSIRPEYPQKKPDLTASEVFFPIILEVLFYFILGIKEALFIKFSKERLTPGAIIPPK